MEDIDSFIAIDCTLFQQSNVIRTQSPRGQETFSTLDEVIIEVNLIELGDGN